MPVVSQEFWTDSQVVLGYISNEARLGKIVEAEVDVESLNEEGDEVDGDLEVAIEEEQNISINVAEFCV